MAESAPVCVLLKSLSFRISDLRKIGIPVKSPGIKAVRGMKLTYTFSGHVADQFGFQPAGRAGLRFSAKTISEAS